MKRSVFLLVIILLLFGFNNVKAEVKQAVQKDIIKVFSSSVKEANVAENAFDGDPGTRWESEFNVDPTWIAVKLKKKRLIKAIKINWERAAASVYQVEISNDGEKWKKVKKIEDGKGDEKRVIKFKKAVTTKYLRIFGESRTIADCGYSIWEVELNPMVFDDNSKVKIKKAKASSFQTLDVPADIDFSAAMTVDGNNETRWSSEFEDPQWLSVELKKKRKIKAVKIKWEDACAKVYKIQVSEDGSSWKEVASINNGASGEEKIISFKPVKAKYVRMYGEERNGQWGYSIWEIEVYK